MTAIVAVVWKFATSKLGLGLIGSFAVVVFLWLHLAGDAKARHERDAWRIAAGDWKASSLAYKAALGRSEALRASEYGDAKAAVSAAQGMCLAQVAEARKSERVIRQIVTKEVRNDPQGCPVRDPVSADELRRALTPAP